MKKFEAVVTRISYAYKTITVEAENMEQARSLVLEQAGNEEFSEKSADYDIENIAELNATVLNFTPTDGSTAFLGKVREYLKTQGYEMNDVDEDTVTFHYHYHYAEPTAAAERISAELAVPYEDILNLL